MQTPGPLGKDFLICEPRGGVGRMPSGILGFGSFPSERNCVFTVPNISTYKCYFISLAENILSMESSLLEAPIQSLPMSEEFKRMARINGFRTLQQILNTAVDTLH